LWVVGGGVWGFRGKVLLLYHARYTRPEAST
jgi:hypothetical protein